MSTYHTGPDYLRRDDRHVTYQDLSSIRQRMLNLEETVKKLKAEIETFKDK